MGPLGAYDEPLGPGGPMGAEAPLGGLLFRLIQRFRQIWEVAGVVRTIRADGGLNTFPLVVNIPTKPLQ